MRKVLKKEFFNRPAISVAKDLLGKYLVRRIGNEEISLPITEVEAYFGHDDEGSHAHKGKTKRNEPMFGPAGNFYIYLIYGMYEMLNIVVDEEHFPAAILIRGAGDLNGPGKLTRYFEIDRRLNGKPAVKETGLWFEDRGEGPRKDDVVSTTRIGINYASEHWRDQPFRFVWTAPKK